MVPDFFIQLSSFANSTWPSMRIGHSTYGYDENARCSNPEDFVDNSDCPEDEPHCNCPCQDLIPKKETVFFDESDDITDGNRYKVLNESGDEVNSFNNPTDAHDWIKSSGEINPRPIDECSLIESNLGSDWLGCDWNNPESELNCSCPCVNSKFKDYLEYNRTYAMYWNTPKHTPLYRNMLMSTIMSKKSTLTANGDFSLRPGNIIEIEDNFKFKSSLPERKHTGNWLISTIEHIITATTNHTMSISLLRDTNKFDSLDSYFEEIDVEIEN